MNSRGFEPTDVAVALEDCQKGQIYRLRSRNLAYGVYDGDTGFIGIREKFGDLYLFTEYHYDTGPPFGTVRPYEIVGDVPEDIALTESLGTQCSNCGERAFYVPWPEGKAGNKYPGRWCHVDEADEPIESGCDNVMATRISNQVLFDLLAVYEQRDAQASDTSN